MRRRVPLRGSSSLGRGSPSARRERRDQIVYRLRHCGRGGEIELVDRDECADSSGWRERRIAEDSLQPASLLQDERPLSLGHHHDPRQGETVHAPGFIETVERPKPIALEPHRVVDETHLSVSFRETVEVPFQPSQPPLLTLVHMRRACAGSLEDWHLAEMRRDLLTHQLQ
jgi:hypothetical protein